MKTTLKQIIFEQQTTVSKTLIERNVPQNIYESTEIVVISGIRRCGKSTLLQQIRNQQPEKDYYCNFDDDRLITFRIDDFQTLYEVFIELFGEQHTFYFDEIQNISGWERFVRRLYDAGNKVFVTGSNASMLSKELGTHLTGRYIQYELYPFSFGEYLQWKQVEISEKNIFTTAGKALYYKEFQLFLLCGGFPQYLHNRNGEYLQSLYESILYRDVMVRNKLTNERELLELVYYLASNVAKLASYNSLTKVIAIKNATTIKNYMNFLENSYLIFQISKFDYSVKKQVQNPKKIYFIDNALALRLGFSFSDNSGRFLENAVFLELIRQGKELFYHQQTYECDFVVRENSQITEAIQVCHSFESDATKKREIQGLQEVMKVYNLTVGYIITIDTEETIQINNSTIYILPVWKWTLKNKII